MNTMARRYFEDFPVGTTFDLPGPTVSADDIKAFASQFDPQPFHLDEAAAQASVLGGLCASGWHTAALCMRAICDGYLLDSASQGSPGIDELRWVKPLYAGDRIRVKATVEEVRPSRSKPTLGSVKARWEVYNQRGELLMHLTGWGLFLRRPT
jgi:acyl dehydratase